MRLAPTLLTLSLACATFAQTPPVTLLKGATVVDKPGSSHQGWSVLVENGVISAVGPNIAAPTGAQVIDCAGLTVYAGFVHPYLRAQVEGVSPAASAAARGGFGRGGQTQQQATEAMAARDKDPFGRTQNILTTVLMSGVNGKDVADFGTLAKSGYGTVGFGASGGILGPVTGIFSTGSGKLGQESRLQGRSSVGLSLGSRGFGSYPSSTMGLIALVRQALFDAAWSARLKAKGQAFDKAANFDALEPVVSGQASLVFEDLTEVSFYQAKKLYEEFALSPVLLFRSDVGKVLRTVPGGAQILLRGSVPTKPTISDDFAASSVNQIRSYFNEMQAGREVVAAGKKFCYAPSSTLDPFGGIRSYVQGGLSRADALSAMTTWPAEFLGVGSQVGQIAPGFRGNLVVVQGDILDSSSQVMATFVDGKRTDFTMPERKKAEDIKSDPAARLAPVNYAAYPAPAETRAATRLYKGATVWTMGPQGVIEGGEVLISDGKIVAVGKGLRVPAGCEVIDATGKHISPGIWDCHSHTGIAGSVNESTNMVTAECRIADVIDHTQVGIYQQLAGGTVGANQLHGSANAIGGQNSTVKWRWGLTAVDYPVKGAPGGVKFALGQNPIREPDGGVSANGSTLLTWRPQTRMGVEEAIRRALQLGKEYDQAWADFRAGKTSVEPRRDVQLEALGEIASGRRWIHSHGYRADELLMLIRVVKEYGGKLATLQHVLEGYKIADEMAAAGVGGSTFADWWGYKLEAYDAVPHNAALMAARGVSVSVNSDSGDHARRLNAEAAKSIRYGGASDVEALSFVTIEPCKQMGISGHTGSLEAGKDADMVVWTDNPMQIGAVCLETYVDGVKRFDRRQDKEQQEARLKEIAAAKEILAPKAEPTATAGPFDSGSKAAAPVDETGPAKVKFGLAPVKGDPGTVRYPRTAIHIVGATVHPMTGDPFVGDVVVGVDGLVAQVGAGLRTPRGATKIDGAGKHVYPGLIDPSTTLGLAEIGQVPTSDDSGETGSFHPDYRIERTINPEWESLAVAREQGVLTAVVRPAGSGWGGQAALINTEGYTWEDLCIQGSVAMAYSAGGGGFGFGGHDHDHDENLLLPFDDGAATAGLQRRGGGGGNLGASLEEVSKQLQAAKDYAGLAVGATPEHPVARDQRQEALFKVASGAMPIMVAANSADDIKAAVAWAEKEGVSLVLYGCSGAGEIADWLAKKNVPVILAAVYSNPREDQPVDYYYSLPAKLAKAGVQFCLTTNDSQNVRQIRDQAGWGATFGLSREDAVRSITLWPAQILGISDRIGSIAPGMEGTIILTDGEIIETRSRVLRAWIRGREVDLTNRQTRLYEKYKNRPGRIPG